MNNKLLATGALLAFLAMALPGNAYHIVADRSTPDGTTDPTHWGPPLGVSNPAGVDPTCSLVTGCLIGTGVIFGFTTCEQNADASSGAPSAPGSGGLCFMSPGYTWDTTTSTCVMATDHRSNSNGNIPDFNGVDTTACAADGSNPVIGDSHVARDWKQIQMISDFGNTASVVAFGAQIDGVSCQNSDGTLRTGTSVVYDNQYAYTVDDGHVSGFPNQAPAPGGFGGYIVSSSSGPGSLVGCNGPQPFYQ